MSETGATLGRLPSQVLDLKHAHFAEDKRTFLKGLERGPDAKGKRPEGESDPFYYPRTTRIDLGFSLSLEAMV